MLTNALRPFWIPGIFAVQRSTHDRMSDWVDLGQYYFDGLVEDGKVDFIPTLGVTLQGLYAGEIVRFSSAAIETALQIERHREIPQSLGWLVIQSYYAAYFSAHLLMRLNGVSCTQFDGQLCARINEIALALGMYSSPVKSGTYVCKYNANRNQVVSRRQSGNKGVHEQFWSIFKKFIEELSVNIISSNSLPEGEAQTAANRLDDLCCVLSSDGCNGGNWLSMIRNQVNYNHKKSTWFPNWSSKRYCESLFVKQCQWRLPTQNIVLNDKDDLKQFICVCSFLIALCRESIAEIIKRSTPNKSFLDKMARFVPVK